LAKIVDVLLGDGARGGAPPVSVNIIVVVDNPDAESVRDHEAWASFQRQVNRWDTDGWVRVWLNEKNVKRACRETKG
jgi:hypothetical protein